jgi:hypothetical protein
MRLTRRFAFLGVAMLALGVALAPARSIVDPKPASASGWLGTCYAIRSDNVAGGWCDGNGPDATYQASVVCVAYDNYNNWARYYANSPWAGDRRGSYVTCPPNFYPESWQVVGRYGAYYNFCSSGGQVWYKECPSN